MSPSLDQINRVVILARMLSENQLDRLIAALGSRKLQLDDGALAVIDTVGLTGTAASDLVGLLRDWGRNGSTSRELSTSLATARATLQHTRAIRPHIQLVWTGPLEAGAQTRSTLMVLQELIAAAEQEIVIVGYTITDGAAPIMASLAAARRRSVHVTIIANRIDQSRRLIRRLWPAGVPGPMLFTYPQSDDDQIASLHAKVVIVDSQRMLLTSANLTYHGLEGNIELGALIEDEIVTRTVRLMQLLIERQIVVPVSL